jgi:LysM repeat protein
VRKSNEKIAEEVIAGAWGNGEDRKSKIKQAGYDYNAIQDIVNEKTQPVRKSNDEIASEVIAGKWGDGNDRKNRLEQAGYDYNAIQNIVNQKLGASQEVYYTVQSGDTLSGIASRYGTTYQHIAQINGLADPNRIYAGQKIRIK